jgi:CBS domain-containing protein
MKCADLMKQSVHCAQASDTVQSAARVMRDQNIGFLPICDERGQVVGTLTDRDITIRLATEDRSAAQSRIGDIMTREMVACRPTDDLAEAERLMATHKKSRILVTDAGGVICGVISLSDIAERDTATRAAVTMRQVSSREAHS